MSYQSTPYSEPKNPVGRVAELFAGVGGFRIGLARAGWQTTYSNQYEPSTKKQHASEVYSYRFGEEGHSNQDVATVSEFPADPDLLVGGFPCQDYSVAKSLSSSKGLEGKKGVLWWEIHRLVKNHKPTFIFLENVDRLLKSPSSQRGRDFSIMLKTLGDLGYMIEWRAVNASDYGFPQRRIRVFIVARRLDTYSKKINPSEIIYLTGVLPRALPVIKEDFPLKEIDLAEDVEVISETFNQGGKISPYANSGFYLDGKAYTVKTTADFSGKKLTLGDVLLPDAEIPNEYWINPDRISEWEYLKGAKSIPRTHKGTGITYNYAEGKMAFPDLLTNPSRTILTGEGGTSPSRFKHVVRTEKGYRRLTPLELERLNGFPDGWTETGLNGEKISDVRRAFFMGNALVVGLIDRVGQVLREDQVEVKTS